MHECMYRYMSVIMYMLACVCIYAFVREIVARLCVYVRDHTESHINPAVSQTVLSSN
jgi:hypothetical protein